MEEQVGITIQISELKLNQNDQGFRVLKNCGIQEPFELFVCPISGKLMKDPVIIESGQVGFSFPCRYLFIFVWILSLLSLSLSLCLQLGMLQTYEAESIRKYWRDTGNIRCPKTGQNLSTNDVVPNIVFKELIDAWHNTSPDLFSQQMEEPEQLSTDVVAASAQVGSSFPLSHLLFSGERERERIKSNLDWSCTIGDYIDGFLMQFCVFSYIGCCSCSVYVCVCVNCGRFLNRCIPALLSVCVLLESLSSSTILELKLV